MFVPRHEFMFGAKPGTQKKTTISVQSKEDFPTLGEGFGVKPVQTESVWSKMAPLGTQPPKKVQKVKDEDPFPLLPGCTPKAIEPVASKSLFEEVKTKPDEIIVKKGGKKGKGKQVVVEVKGNFY